MNITKEEVQKIADALKGAEKYVLNVRHDKKNMTPAQLAHVNHDLDKLRKAWVSINTIATRLE